VVELEVLGPLVVWARGRQLRLGPALRVLLLCLLCADGELVLAGRLAGLLSETGSPGGSPATLLSHVSHLRRAISDATGQGRDDRDCGDCRGVSRGLSEGFKKNPAEGASCGSHNCCDHGTLRKNIWRMG
jgi:hypothetical protein